ncbi:MAG TPA: stage 0 sporulation family protein [Chthonomonadales bacterium]|nr:stage 0 sporulation family protein [Chthonomonadales bacterium]
MDRVIVETARGLEIGTVRVTARMVPEEELQAPLKRVVRLANANDLEQEARNKERAREAMHIAIDRIKYHELPMKVIQAEYTFDGSQVTIYFAAENRVDFRELVKDLAGRLRCKVQLYQIGARDQAKMIGGVGPCGLTLCCATFLTEFAPISMKMAKDQSLFLNPVKFSGVCGKLMCCLRYEHDNYVEAKQRLPQVGDLVMTPKGQGRVTGVNIIKEEVMVTMIENEIPLTFPASEVRVERTTKCPSCRGCSVDTLKEDYKDASYSDGTPEELDLSELEG